MAEVVHNILEKLNLSKSSGEAPKEPDPQELQELREKFVQAQQDHVFHYYDGLSVTQKAELFEQLVKIDPQHVNELAQKVLKPQSEEHQKPSKLDPLPESASASVLDSKEDDLNSWSDFGLELVAQNKVAVVLMAGGQGTRLGSSAPKGCYNIGLPSGKSLFQLQAERIAKLQDLAASKHSKDKVVIPWYVMTSGPTKQPTQDYFSHHKYFGLEEENVTIFEQGTLPCISNEGKILMEDKAKVSSHLRPVFGTRLSHFTRNSTGFCRT